MKMPVRIGIALGSNVGDRLSTLEAARSHILAIARVHLPCLSSRIYETEPVDTAPGTDPFLNAVIEVGFDQHPLELLRALQSLEELLGRPRIHGHHTPRTIDLDILYADSTRLDLPELQIPHPRLSMRRFVLAPLCDIRPDLVLPGFTRNISESLQNLEDPAAVYHFPCQWKD